MADQPSTGEPNQSGRHQGSYTPESGDPGSNGDTARSPILIIGLVIVILILIGAIAYLILGADSGASSPAPPEVSAPTPLPNSPRLTALEAVNVRSGPGTEYPSYGVAAQGAQAEAIGVSADGAWWVASISTQYAPDGQGWVSGQYVQAENTDGLPIIEAPPLPPPVEVEPPQEDVPLATALDYIYVRSGPGTNYPEYGVAAPGAQAEVIGVSEDSEWWVVTIPTNYAPDGRGWVSADWVSVEGNVEVPVVPKP